MKVQLEIPADKLLYVNVPPEFSKFRIVNYGYAGMWLMETESKELNHWKISLPKGKTYEVLGFVNDVIVGEIHTYKNFVLRIL